MWRSPRCSQISCCERFGRSRSTLPCCGSSTRASAGWRSPDVKCSLNTAEKRPDRDGMEQRIKTIGIGFHDVVESLSEARPIAPGHTTFYTIDRGRLREHLLAIRSVTPVTTLYHI